MPSVKPLSRRRFSQLSAATAGLALLPISTASAQTVSGLYDNIPIEDNVMGDANAKVTIVEYASMTCPHCRSFHENILPAVKEKFVDTGKVKFILRPFPFDGDRRGEAAFMLAKCAPNDNYYAMVDALFSTQNVWADPKTNPVPELVRLSKLAGMSEAEFEKCLAQQDLLTKIIEGRNKAVKDFGVRSTPTLFINDEKFSGDLTEEGLTKAIEAAL
mgnify:CR=1 FL=1